MISQQDWTPQAQQALAVLQQFGRRAIALGAQATQAASRVDEIESLEGRLIAQQRTTRSASRSLDSLVALKRQVQGENSGLTEAHEALQGLVDLKCRATAEAALDRRRHRNCPTIVRSTKLADQRRQADGRSSNGQPATDRHRKRPGGAGSDTPAARAALEGLIQIRETLDRQAPSLDLAAARAEQLIALKDSIIAQTSNLAEAIETLELAADLDHQVQQAVAAFGKMRHALVEILAFEPGIQRALVILEPLTALGNLRHISGAELRDVARLVRDQHKALTERPAQETSAARATGSEGTETK